MGGVAAVGTCPEIGGINTRVGITVKEGIEALPSVYSRRVCKWASPC